MLTTIDRTAQFGRNGIMDTKCLRGVSVETELTVTEVKLLSDLSQNWIKERSHREHPLIIRSLR